MIASLLAAALSAAVASSSPAPRVAAYAAQPTGIFNVSGTLSAAAAGRFAIVAEGNQLIAFDENGRRIDEESVDATFDETIPTLQRFWSASSGEFAFFLAGHSQLFRARVVDGSLEVVDIPMPRYDNRALRAWTVLANKTQIALNADKYDGQGAEMVILDHAGAEVDSWDIADDFGPVAPLAFRDDGSLVVFIDKHPCSTLCYYGDLYIAVVRKGVPLSAVPHHHLGLASSWPASALRGDHLAVAWLKGPSYAIEPTAVVLEAIADQNTLVPVGQPTEVKGRPVHVPGMFNDYEPAALLPTRDAFVLMNTSGPLHLLKDGVLTSASGGPENTLFAVELPSNRVLRFFVAASDLQLYAEPLLMRTRPRTVRQ